MDRSSLARRAFLRGLTGTAATGLVVGAASAGAQADQTTTGAGAAAATDATAPPTTAPDGYEPLGRLPLSGLKEAVVGPDGTTVFCAVTDGFAVVDANDPADPRLLAERRGILADRENGPLKQVYDVTVEGDRLLVAGPANPGQGDLRAAVLYDVSDPANPEQTGVYETEFFHHNVFLRDGLAYFTGNGVEGAPLVVADVAAGEELGRWSVTSVEPGWRDLPHGLWTLHDLWVQDGVAYLAHWDAGTWMVDVSDPTAPELVAKVRGRTPDAFAGKSSEALGAESVEPPGNDHYVTVNDDASLLVVGAEAWDVDPDDDHGGPGGIDLYDVTDPTAPEHLSAIDPPPTDNATFSGTWVTSHNFDLVGDRLYTSWYAGGVRVFDVSDPAAPQLLSAWRDSAATSFWTAQAARPGEFYVASSRRAPEDSASSPALYTFPDTADTPATSDTTATTEPTTGTDSGGTTTSAGSNPDDTTATTGPGFGVAAAVTALGLAAWRARSRVREE